MGFVDLAKALDEYVQLSGFWITMRMFFKQN